MSYVDIAPSEASNGCTVVLLHGKNLPGATWDVEGGNDRSRSMRRVLMKLWRHAGALNVIAHQRLGDEA